MKVSADMNSPAFRGYGRYEVFLNGEKVRYCVEADDAEGYVIVLRRNDNGYVLARDRLSIDRDRHEGVVVIVEKARAR